jgi:hypothetical protein
MKTRNQIISLLLVFGIFFYGIVQWMVIPHLEQAKRRYMLDQQDPLRHDIGSVLKFKNKYMGDFSNLANLFDTLPLSDVDVSFQLYPDKLMAEVNYKKAFTDIGEDMVDQVLVYNATAAFALIDNLEGLKINFQGKSYTICRRDVVGWYGVDLTTLLKKDIWNRTVQAKLMDDEYVHNFINKIVK